MVDINDPKTVLHSYLQEARDALMWKVAGLGERELREPRTPTGTNLLGIVKHALNVEAGYFGRTFGREFPQPDELVDDADYDADPQADWYATADESAAGILDLYRRVWVFCDETIEALALDAPGEVPWWRAEKRQVTLQRIIVHVISDLARHAGHADILREQVDGAVGMAVRATNMPDVDWPAYVAKLSDLAGRYA
jgi:uncharacterized damage-inducible protein DinB